MGIMGAGGEVETSPWQRLQGAQVLPRVMCTYPSRSWKQITPLISLAVCVDGLMNRSMGWRGLTGGQNETIESELKEKT